VHLPKILYRLTRYLAAGLKAFHVLGDTLGDSNVAVQLAEHYLRPWISMRIEYHRKSLDGNNCIDQSLGILFSIVRDIRQAKIIDHFPTLTMTLKRVAEILASSPSQHTSIISSLVCHASTDADSVSLSSILLLLRCDFA
jgi:hypothetical protein